MLLLRHLFEGVEIQQNFAEETLKNLAAIWRRPVNLATVIDGKEKVIRHDGKELSFREFSGANTEAARAES